MLDPDAAAQLLGVTATDVIAEIDAGNLKGKKIGTQYRLTRQSLNEFLAG